MATIIITGANGFIGSELLKYLHSAGNKIIALARTKPFECPSDVDFQEYNLLSEVSDEPFKTADFIIHTAYQKYTAECINASEINLKGTQKLLEMSRRHGLKKFVYLSSFSAHSKALSEYGKSKFKIENIFDPAIDLVLKPGLVLGNGGLFLQMMNILKTRKVIPVFSGGKQLVQTIYIYDLISCIENGLNLNVSGVFPLAEKVPITMKELNQAIAEVLGKKIKICSIHYRLVFLAVSLAELFKMKIPVSRENLLGLRHGITYDTSGVEKVFHIPIRPCKESLKLLVKNSF
jgi:nucleoside-diphosphate-sugar epimerase